MPHIVKSFDEELIRLHDSIARMGELTVEQFEKGLDALVNRDDRLAAEVMGSDAAIDQLNDLVNEQVVRVLALRSPMADDLRMVVTALKVASALERIADYGVNIARRALVLNTSPPVPSIHTVKRMGLLVCELVRGVVEAYLQRDADKAVKVWSSDREVDEIYSSLFREFLTYMMEDSRNIAPYSNLLFIAKNIERVGDHATNIGEMVYFLVTGQSLTGERPKGDTTTRGEGQA